MDKFEKFLRSEMSARRLCELAEGESLGLVADFTKVPAPTDGSSFWPSDATALCLLHLARRDLKNHLG